MTYLRTGALVAACVSLGACATVTRGTSTNLQVSTYPAGASVQASNGEQCAATPCALRVSRKDDFSATITKFGYRPQQVQVSPHISSAGATALAGNILIGGLIGASVDLTSGAMNDFKPVDVKLEPNVFGPSATRPLPPRLVDLQDAPAFPPAASTQTANAGRTVSLRLMPDGTFRETRSAF